MESLLYSFKILFKMRIFYSLLIALFLTSACQSPKKEGVAIINLSALASVPLDTPIDQLAKDGEFIEVNLPADARIDQLSQKDLSLLKAAAYRFYGHVKLVNNRYQVDIREGKEINVEDDVVQAYIKALGETNNFADSLQKEGQDIKLPEITDAYRNTLLK
ncbi:hypothetical protein ACR79M_16640 [Sphingobacterium spiritivorum]|uniref:hypothetical protein n=2 Tax=Sphingobacterium spiritivorum TaxID=258 RepID=UPI003DA286BA